MESTRDDFFKIIFNNPKAKMHDRETIDNNLKENLEIFCTGCLTRSVDLGVSKSYAF